MKNIFPGVLLAMCASILWGTTGTAQSFLTPGSVTPYWVAAIRLLFACVFFFGMLVMTKSTVCPQKHSRQYWNTVVGAASAIALFNIAFFQGVSLSGVALGSVCILGSSPIWTGVLEWIFLGQAPRLRWLLGTAISITGGAVLVLGNTSIRSFSWIGLCVCLFAGLMYATYTMTSKKLVAQVSPLVATTHTFSLAAVIALIVAMLFAPLPQMDTTAWTVTAYLGIITTGIAYWLFTSGLKQIHASVAVTLNLLEPLTACLLAVLVVHETIAPTGYLGLAGIIAGLAIILYPEKK